MEEKDIDLEEKKLNIFFWKGETESSWSIIAAKSTEEFKIEDNNDSREITILVEDKKYIFSADIEKSSKEISLNFKIYPVVRLKIEKEETVEENINLKLVHFADLKNWNEEKNVDLDGYLKGLSFVSQAKKLNDFIIKNITTEESKLFIESLMDLSVYTRIISIFREKIYLLFRAFNLYCFEKLIKSGQEEEFSYNLELFGDVNFQSFSLRRVSAPIKNYESVETKLKKRGGSRNLMIKNQVINVTSSETVFWKDLLLIKTYNKFYEERLTFLSKLEEKGFNFLKVIFSSETFFKSTIWFMQSNKWLYNRSSYEERIFLKDAETFREKIRLTKLLHEICKTDKSFIDFVMKSQLFLGKDLSGTLVTIMENLEEPNSFYETYYEGKKPEPESENVYQFSWDIKDMNFWLVESLFIFKADKFKSSDYHNSNKYYFLVERAIYFIDFFNESMKIIERESEKRRAEAKRIKKERRKIEKAEKVEEEKIEKARRAEEKKIEKERRDKVKRIGIEINETKEKQTILRTNYDSLKTALLILLQSKEEKKKLIEEEILSFEDKITSLIKEHENVNFLLEEALKSRQKIEEEKNISSKNKDKLIIEAKSKKKEEQSILERWNWQLVKPYISYFESLNDENYLKKKVSKMEKRINVIKEKRKDANARFSMEILIYLPFSGNIPDIVTFEELLFEERSTSKEFIPFIDY